MLQLKPLSPMSALLSACSPERLLCLSPLPFTGHWQPSRARDDIDGHATTAPVSGHGMLSVILGLLRNRRQERILSPQLLDDSKSQLDFPMYIRAGFIQPVVDFSITFGGTKTRRESATISMTCRPIAFSPSQCVPGER
ncbi:hypothetical protein FA95DRAFT_1232760 [Auriscalpium vulgare]|uniref:Uncharacterized protein n=1 Tax=Auriscalpium vulgare TaxID=40419 RepID=A0ACB8RU31_9AGAM|nr:hypothetical protein FA95DRAFT_1232760 [Auriscalpium vulgare]